MQRASLWSMQKPCRIERPEFCLNFFLEIPVFDTNYLWNKWINVMCNHEARHVASCATQVQKYVMLHEESSLHYLLCYNTLVQNLQSLLWPKYLCPMKMSLAVKLQVPLYDTKKSFQKICCIHFAGGHCKDYEDEEADYQCSIANRTCRNIAQYVSSL